MSHTFSFILCVSIAGIGFTQTSGQTVKESTTITVRPAFGFNLGVDYSLISNMTPSGEPLLCSPVINNGLGFRLGVFGDLKIQERFSLSQKVELSFNSTTLEHNNQTKELDPVNLNFMLHGKYNLGKKVSKVNPYFYFGPALRIPLENNSAGSIETKISWYGDVALGLDIDFGVFYISPEFRFSRGLTNMRKDESAGKLRSSYAAFVLNFTGK
jgi:hypothetical protein